MDRLEVERTIRQTYTARDLYAITDHISKGRDTGRLGRVDYEELMELIMRRFAELESVAKEVG